MPNELIAVESSAGLATVRPLSQSPAAVYLSRLAPGSRRTMKNALDTIAALLTGGKADALSTHWGNLRYQEAAAIRAELAARYAPATANKMLAALRGVLKEAWRLGQINAEDYRQAVDIQTVRSSTIPKGRALASRELGKLLEVCMSDTTAAGARDAALIMVLYGAGLRRSEVVGLDLEDYSEESGGLTIRHGKGNKDRLAYIGSDAAGVLADWLEIRGTQSGPLFCPVLKSGEIILRQMTPQAVLLILRKRAEEAGVASFSPHDLRRSFITSLLDNGIDIETVRKLAGHANVQTTSRYDRRGEETKRKAVDKLSVPAVRRRK